MQQVIRPVGAAIAIDPAIPRETIAVRAEDGGQSWGVLYTPAHTRARHVVHLMHPRGDMSRHYVVPGMIRAGIAVFASNSRYLNNDRDCVHERILLDIAAGQTLLRERGFEGRVLFGNSGGGSLFAFYQAQAATAPPNRLRDIPGDPGLDLNQFAMPEGDCYVSVASHRGQGMFMLGVIDPSVIDEADPTLTDPALDMFNPDNGFRPLPETSRYTAEFVARYRQAQAARVARLDAVAHAHLARQHEALARERAGGGSLGEQTAIRKAAALDQVMVIYRTLANPLYLDPTIDPNDRPLGSIFAPDPLVGNYTQAGALGRVMTPRGWLSTWSGLSSKANLTDNLARVRIPSLIVNAHGDSDIFPADARAIFDASAATDKEFHSLTQAGHYLNQLPGGSGPEPREQFADLLVSWLQARLS